MSSENAVTADARSALGAAESMVVGYTIISVLTVGAIVLMRHDSNLVTDTVWVRGIIVAATALLMLSFASGAGKGKPRALLRLRIVSALMVGVIVVIIVLPGAIPMWMKIEQGVCGLLLLGVVVLVNGRKVRSSFKR